MAGNTTLKGNYLDKGCVRVTVGIVGFLLVALAIFSLWLGIEANYCTELTLLDINKKVSYVLICAGAVLFMTAAFGWTAAATKDDCLSFCFGYLAMCIMLVFTSMGVSILVVKSSLAQQMNEGCQLKSGMVYELDQIYSRGQDVLCSDVCPCNADPGIFSTEVAEKMKVDNMGQTRLEECPYDASVLNEVQKTKYFPILEILETDFKCSGFCSEANFFLFSDVRNGPPSEGTCKAQIINVVSRHASLFAGILISIGCIGLVGFGMSFAVCNMQRRKYHAKEFYDYSKWGMSKEA